MIDALEHLSKLKRPSLLIRAARHGLSDYSRERTLSRLLEAPCSPPDQILERLVQTEAEIEATRTRGDVSYSVSRHLEVLIALMGEARLLLSRPLGSNSA